MVYKGILTHCVPVKQLHCNDFVFIVLVSALLTVCYFAGDVASAQKFWL